MEFARRKRPDVRDRNQNAGRYRGRAIPRNYRCPARGFRGMSPTTGEDWPTSGTRESDRPRHRATQQCLGRGSAAVECGEGKGTVGNRKRIDSGRRTTKVSRRPRTFGQSEGYARDHGEMGELGRPACDSAAARPVCEKLRARAAAGSRQPARRGEQALLIGISAENSRRFETRDERHSVSRSACDSKLAEASPQLRMSCPRLRRWGLNRRRNP